MPSHPSPQATPQATPRLTPRPTRGSHIPALIHRWLICCLIAATGWGCQMADGPAASGNPTSGDDGTSGTSTPTETRADTLASDAARPWRGKILAIERFDDMDFEARGWYDGPRGSLDDPTPPGLDLNQTLECRLERGTSSCADGTPGRLEFEPTEAVFLSYHVRYDDGWVGSERPYHPHEFHFLTTADDRYVGPAYTHLTVYIEQTGLRPMIALQDSRNVNPDCVLRNNDSVVGCSGGTVESFPFGEDRSVASCNGLVGELDQRDCFPLGDGRWYSSRAWRAPGALMNTGRWHHVEAAVILNSIEDGVGIPDGRIRLWVDGEEVVGSDQILLRTAAHPDMQFRHLLLAPYIGDGSPVTQTLRIGPIIVARAQTPD